MRSFLLSLILVALIGVADATAQTTFFNTGTIQKIEISLPQANWDYTMDTMKSGSGGYVMAQWVKINGIQYDSVGVKYKGNSSYDSSRVKNPLHINLKKYKTQTHENLTDIKLANCYQDPSMIREVLSYAILGNYMDCPRANFAQVYINGNYIGLYSNDEDVNKKYVTDKFFSYSANRNSFIKCSHDNPSSTTRSNLKYLSADSSQYEALYELESNVGWNDLAALCDTVTNYNSGLSSFLDMDRVIWMLAYNNAMVNLDSYSGLFSQNYYMFKDNTGHFNPIMWDLNMSLGGFPFAGNQAGGTGSLTITNMQQLSPVLHAADSEWPLIKAVMSNAMYKRMYLAHLRTIVNEQFVTNAYQTLATQLQSVVDTAVNADPNKFFTYAQFQGAMTNNYSVGSYSVPGITNLLSARVTYLQSTPEFTTVQPSVQAVAQSAVVSGSITITTRVINAAAVYLGYRLDTTLKFTRVQMYDDGAHGDGAANDNLYGASITASAAQGQYYIYAENNDAGIFSPQRAEHEFYRLGAPTAVVNTTTAANAVKIFPNPAMNVLNIQLPAASGKEVLVVKNTIGQLIYTEMVYAQSAVDISYWPSGIYYVQCGSVMEKIIVIH